MGNIIYKREQTITGGSSSIAGLTSQGTKSSDFTAVANAIYEITASCKVTLPSTPSTNDKVAVVLTATANCDFTTTDKMNGSLLATDYVRRVTQLYTIVVLTYSGSTNGWVWDSRDNSYVNLVYGGALSTDVILYCKFDGSNGSTTITDSSYNPKTITPAGNASLSTTQKKYGASSLYLDGAGDYLSLSLGSDAFNIRTQVFTIEAWIYRTATNKTINLVADQSSGFNFYFLDYYANDQYIGDSVINQFTKADSLFPANQWIHIALVNNNTNLKLFINGTLNQTYNGLFKSTVLNSIYVGKRATETNYYQGYIDSLMITKQAKYTASFDPATDTQLAY